MTDKPAPVRRTTKRPVRRPAAAQNGHGTVRRDLVANEIYEHATRLFSEHGFAGTSLQDIADAVGLTRPALYYYVKGKEELLAKLVTEVTQGSAASIAAIVKRGDLDPAAQLHAIVRMSVQRQAEYAARFRLLILSEAELPADLAATYERGRREVLKLVARVIDRGIEEGTFRPIDARVAALGVLGMNNWIAWWYQPGGRDSIDKISTQLADTAVAGLRSIHERSAADEGRAGVLAQIRHELDRLERLI